MDSHDYMCCYQKPIKDVVLYLVYNFTMLLLIVMVLIKSIYLISVYNVYEVINELLIINSVIVQWFPSFNLRW